MKEMGLTGKFKDFMRGLPGRPVVKNPPAMQETQEMQV